MALEEKKNGYWTGADHCSGFPGRSCGSKSWGSERKESDSRGGSSTLCRQRYHSFHLCLGLVMAAVILCSRKMGINPDNVATPIAASLGDLVTLFVLAGVSSLFDCHKDVWFLSLAVCAFFLGRSVPIREALRPGWEPVILAMSISWGAPAVTPGPWFTRSREKHMFSVDSIGGHILDQTVSDPSFEGMAVFAPVINGVGGNLVAIQASRMSTYRRTPGALPSKMGVTCPASTPPFAQKMPTPDQPEFCFCLLCRVTCSSCAPSTSFRAATLP